MEKQKCQPDYTKAQNKTEKKKKKKQNLLLFSPKMQYGDIWDPQSILNTSRTALELVPLRNS